MELILLNYNPKLMEIFKKKKHFWDTDCFYQVENLKPDKQLVRRRIFMKDKIIIGFQN